MRRLLPDPVDDVTVADLLDGFAPPEDPPGERPFVFTNFVLSLDGRVTLEGRSGPLGSDRDREMLVGLRARADAIMIGAGTMRAERYGAMPEGRLTVIISGRLDLPWDAGLFTEGRGQALVFTSSEEDPPETATPVEVVRDPNGVDLAGALAQLRAERGVRTLLCEGGPHLHGQLLQANLVDELFVTHAPKLAGGQGPGLVAGLAEAERPVDLVWLASEPETDELFARYRVMG